MAVICMKCGKVIAGGPAMLPLVTVCSKCRRKGKAAWFWTAIAANFLLWSAIILFLLWLAGTI